MTAKELRMARDCMDELSGQKPSDWCTPKKIQKANREMMRAIQLRSMIAIRRQGWP
jgi:hypothetical protein